MSSDVDWKRATRGSEKRARWPSTSTETASGECGLPAQVRRARHVGFCERGYRFHFVKRVDGAKAGGLVGVAVFSEALVDFR